VTKLAECDALVAEVLMAWRFAPEGGELSGATLLRWRELPAKERAYFAALVAPCVDEHALTRVSTVVQHDDGSCTCIYEPPFAAPCDCARPLYVDYERCGVRCTRCLHAWSWKLQQVRECTGEPAREIIRELSAVTRVDMGYAIEHVLPKGQQS
jgi:hypothetical protein